MAQSFLDEKAPGIYVAEVSALTNFSVERMAAGATLAI